MKRLTALSILFALIATPALPAVDYDDSPEAWATAIDFVLAVAVLQIYESRGEKLDPPKDTVRLEDHVAELPRMFRSRIPSRDGWGGPIRAGSHDGALVLVSSGRNGELDSYAVLLQGRAENETAYQFRKRLEAGDDIILVVGQEFINHPETALGRQKRTMANMRSVGTAVESFAIDHNRYPDQARGWGELTEIEPDLEPIYIKVLPLDDSWGGPFLYWSDGEQYVLISCGADGVPDVIVDPFEALADGGVWRGATTNPNSDIVFGNGQFLQWPEGRQP